MLNCCSQLPPSRTRTMEWILVGIDDTGHIKSLDLDFKRKDALERRIHQLARARIKPAPPLDHGGRTYDR